MAFKTALRLPMSTSTEKLLVLGLHNTLSELTEALHVSQQQRLARTHTGRQVLQTLGFKATTIRTQETCTIPRHIQDRYHIAPIPRNMDPNLHSGRRKARAQYIEKTFRFDTTARFMDAAMYGTKKKGAVAVVCDRRGHVTSSASTRPCTITEAEELAIALAIREGQHASKPLTILTDSQQACRNFLQGRIARPAAQVLAQIPKEDTDGNTVITIIWIPGHAAIMGNLYADRAAREFAYNRALITPTADDPDPVDPEYSAILNYHRGSRLRYPPPHRILKTEDAAAWLRLQTGTYTNLHLLHRLHPTAYRDECPWCGATPTLYHITWECTLHNIEHHDTNTTREQWEAVLSSSALDDQLKLIQRAEKMARASGALD
ncbi:uncharacterized protein LOC119453712 [Dermacentor silvarum]|uniref:uncharacterized protein LOC119453712 n=1 Tax=Dermacentor silvarum TaxID=543639 RepID=UPI002101561B|nr:uncharacterized protein LOC119453712 [Dermacentor silvarum]